MTNYPSEYLSLLSKRVEKGTLSALDRLGLLNDSFQLAKAGLKSTVDALELMESYTKENDPIVWDIMAGQQVAIRKVMDSDELRDLMKPYAAKLVAKQLDRLGWDEKPADTHLISSYVKQSWPKLALQK